MHIPKIIRIFAATMKRTITTLAIMLVCMTIQAQTRYVGGDISMLPQYEQYSSGYKDVNGKKIQNLLTWLISDCQWNTFRVRIFVNPQQQSKGKADYAVCQDLAYVTALGKRIKDAGVYFMLDFHYSDTWVDALNIQAPEAWKNADAAAMADSLGAYTHRVLQTLKAAGATPDLVQVGNEIMYGMCDIKVSPYDNSATNANWPAYLNLLEAGCNAVREECPQAQIIIHTDHPNDVNNTKYYYNQLVNSGVDFDIIGLSYYPFWHGYLNTTSTNLVNSLNAYAKAFPNKRLHIVECAYNFQYWPSSGVKYNTQSIWPCSVAGQYNFVRDLVDALKPLEQVDGINYWFPEEAGNGDNVNWTTKAGLVIETWLNRGFWDENATSSGHAINRTDAPQNGQTAADVCAPYYMKNFLNESSEDINAIREESVRTHKFIKNSQIVIERNGCEYSVDGRRR